MYVTPELIFARYYKKVSAEPPDILKKIVARKHAELLEATLPASELRARAEAIPAASRRDFVAALRSRNPAIIAEIKKASPSKGVLIEDFQPAQLARQYEQGGAACLSVLTDRDFFHGHLDHLIAARAACRIPVLRKDFTLTEYHVLEAVASGADAILLIAAILSVEELRDLRQFAESLNLAVLVESHDAAELDKTLASGATLVGVNNRDLRTFNVTLETSIKLARQLPPNVTKVSESGIFNATDIHHLQAAGYQAFLVGEHLVKSGNPTQALQALCS